MGLFDRAGLPREEFRSLGESVAGRVWVLAWARGPAGPVVGLAGRLAVRTPVGWRFVGWHQIDSGGWDAASGRLHWTLIGGGADEVVLEAPGSLPDLFRERVGASIVLQERFEMSRGRAAIIVARRRLDDDQAPLVWSVTRQGGDFDASQIERAGDELARLRAEYDIATEVW
ncbi:hypothetical protein [Micropruina sp.]|uniref:hypothetical protein n=1 Tax=Micropruina sp. TaxID=2737536 RepID=UPI0039E39B35